MEHRLALQFMRRSGCSYDDCLRTVQYIGCFEAILWLDRLGRSVRSDDTALRNER